MRNEQEMMNLIMDTAKQDERILAVFMNGSRANPNAPKDIFQDYDIVYVVNETASFIHDKQWIDRFGERMILQVPGEEQTNEEKASSYCWLMLFTDGNRIDLQIQTPNYMKQHIHEESCCVVLLDKAGLLHDMPKTSDRTYWITPPTQERFTWVCNEFWWCLQNVAKGIWRNELTYALEMLNTYVRPQLLSLLQWKAGISTNFTFSGGKSGKYLNKVLDEHEWNTYLMTFAGADVNLLNAIEVMMKQFHHTANEIADKLGLHYNDVEATNMMQYVDHVFHLSTKAKDIY